MPRAMTRGVISASVFLSVACGAAGVFARPIRVHLFTLNRGHDYRVQVNGSDHSTPYSGSAGSLEIAVEAANGDFVSAVDDGEPNLQPPAPPLFTSLDTTGPGCASAFWMPSGDPTVVGYVVSFGRSPGQYDQSVSVSAGASTEVCLLAQGMHYFAVQCRNYAGMLSAYSAERAVEIVVVSVLISRFDARVLGGGVELSWRVEADEAIRGFRVYRADPDQLERAITPELIAPAQNVFLDQTARPATRYRYAVAAVNEAGDETRSFMLDVETPALLLSLGQNVPNPFNPATSIPFVRDATTRVRLRVYDVRGALVATLFEGVLPQGSHAIAWDGRNNAGRVVSSGTYLVSLVAGNHRLSRKMLMVR